MVSLLAVWIGGLPGPYHGAYLAFATLVNIRSGLWSYEQANGHLPPATATDAKSGKKSSWRIDVYQAYVRNGFITAPKANGNDSIDYDRHKAWNDPHNLQLQELGVRLFGYTQQGDECPPGQRMGRAGTYTTYYKAITGPGTAFDSATPPSPEQLPKNLILVVRVENSDTHWMEPGDLSIKQLAASERNEAAVVGQGWLCRVVCEWRRVGAVWQDTNYGFVQVLHNRGGEAARPRTDSWPLSCSPVAVVLAK